MVATGAADQGRGGANRITIIEGSPKIIAIRESTIEEALGLFGLRGLRRKI